MSTIDDEMNDRGDNVVSIMPSPHEQDVAEADEEIKRLRGEIDTLQSQVTAAARANNAAVSLLIGGHKLAMKVVQDQLEDVLARLVAADGEVHDD